VAEYSRELKEERYAKTAKNDRYDDACCSSPFSASPQTSTAKLVKVIFSILYIPR
jgi:hypothetical protein